MEELLRMVKHTLGPELLARLVVDLESETALARAQAVVREELEMLVGPEKALELVDAAAGGVL